MIIYFLWSTKTAL